MSMEDRIAHVETETSNLDVQVKLLTGIAERQLELLERLDANLGEVRRDTEMTRRLWVHLARKHGWLEDEDWPPPEA